ncbi:MAG: pectinesterase family protein [Thermoplasmata archaeon]
MYRRIAAIWLCFAIILTTVVIFIEIALPARATTIYVDDDGGADYTSIQDAINAASDDNTVYVYSGTYYENVMVNRSISLIGEDKNTTIINGDGNSSVVSVVNSGVNLTGFTCSNGGDSPESD